MKKIIVLFLFMTTAVVSFGQSEKLTKSDSTTKPPEFLGIEVNGKRDEVIDAFKRKGFTVDGDINKSNVATMKGSVGGRNFILYIVSSPKSKIVWKLSVDLPEQSSWSSLKSDYLQYLEILTNKYGEPEKKYDFFSSPYKEGDGYEMTGVANSKSHYSAYWNDEKGISIEITKWKSVSINYENQNNIKIYKKEKSELDSAIF